MSSPRRRASTFSSFGAVAHTSADSSEGLVVKNLTSNYHPGSRTNAWIKVKPEYMNELQETLDCLVVGMKVWEEGGVVWKSGFVVAVRDGNEQVDGQPW